MQLVKACAICTSNKRREIEQAMATMPGRELAKRFGVRRELIKAHREHSASAADPAGKMKTKAEQWIEHAGDLALQAARVTIKSRGQRHLGIGYLSRVTDFARLAGEAGGLLQRDGQHTTNVQANVMLLPRGSDETQ